MDSSRSRRPGPAPLLARPVVAAPLRLNIGCGNSPRPAEEGWVNCDLHPGSRVDRVFDCQRPWPFADGSAAEIYSSHTLEHLADYSSFFREAWRVLRPQGQITVRVPYAWHSACWWDFTHLRPWCQESFATLQPGFAHFTHNLQHDPGRLGFAFWIVQATLVFNRPWSRLWRLAPLRPLCRWAGRCLINVFREVIVDAVKTTFDDAESAAFGGTRHPCMVPCAYAVWEHEFHGWDGAALPAHRLLVFRGAVQGAP